jgi:hypothetical protein
LAVAAYALVKVLGESGWKEVLLWFAICAVVHDLVVWPVYGIADRAALLVQSRSSGGRPRVPWINHVRVPTIISVLLLVMFFPLILRLSNSYYQEVTGFNENVYVVNWLAVTGILFAGSAVIYAVRLGWAHRRARAAAALLRKRDEPLDQLG